MVHELPTYVTPSKERRRFQRLQVSVPATLISTALGRVNAVLVDISQAGCRIRTRARAHRGEYFVLTIGELGPRAVQAAWRHDGQVGLAFAEPLGWAVVMQMAIPDAVTAERRAEWGFRRVR